MIAALQHYYAELVAWLKGHNVDSAISSVTTAIEKLEATARREEQKALAHVAAIESLVVAKEKAFAEHVRASRIAQKFAQFID